jgi:hypothetical protein
MLGNPNLTICPPKKKKLKNSKKQTETELYLHGQIINDVVLQHKKT